MTRDQLDENDKRELRILTLLEMWLFSALIHLKEDSEHQVKKEFGDKVKNLLSTGFKKASFRAENFILTVLQHYQKTSLVSHFLYHQNNFSDLFKYLQGNFELSFKSAEDKKDNKKSNSKNLKKKWLDQILMYS